MDITLWFNTKIEVSDTSIPRYFILKKAGIAEWKYNISELNDFILLGTIKIHSSSSFKLLVSKNINRKSYNFEASKYNKTHIPILKSNLQKSIRRNKIEIALKTTYQMLSISPNDFFRRLPIIFLEDVKMNHLFTGIIWYMIAVSKGYKLTYTDVKWVMYVVYNLALCDNKEIIEKNNVINKIDNLKDFIKLIKGEYYKENFNIIWSSIIRYFYGGTKHDIQLFLDFLILYKNKKIKDEFIEKDIIPEIYTVFNKTDILLASIDFHCTNIINLLLKKYQQDKSYYQLYKECIWYNRSRTTKKNIIGYLEPKKHIELYNKIKKDLNEISKKIIFFMVS